MFDSKFAATLFALTLTGACSDAEDNFTDAPADASAPLELRSTSRPALRIPRPTGPFSVGVRTTYVQDASRLDSTTQKPRALPTWIYYPAFPDVERAPYLSPRVQASLETNLGWPPGTLDVDAGILAAPRSRASLRGILLVSGGWATPVAFETALISELTSHGYVVVAFDHPRDTAVVEQPDGELIEGMKVAGDAAFAARVLDVGVILEQLDQLVPDATSATPVAMWGHSMGGATAVEALRSYPRLRAAVDVDGTPRGRVVDLGTDEPVGVLSSNTFVSEGLEDTILATLLSNLRGPHPHVNMYGIAHYGFSDFVLFNQQVRRVDADLAARMEATFSTDSESLDESHRTVARQRDFLVRFMNRYVAHR